MGELICFESRPVQAKGLQKGQQPHLQKIKEYLFSSEYENLILLKNIIIPPTASVPQKCVLIYPGCGTDLLMPLLYLEHLFPPVQEAKFLFIDIHDALDCLKTVLDDIGISFEEQKERHKNVSSLRFYWKEKLITLKMIEGNIFSLLDELPSFDIYFERAFRIMKDGHDDYEQKIVEKLNWGGILISDSGFVNTSLKIIDVPNELSAYGEMVMGRKEKEYNCLSVRESRRNV